MIFGFNSSAMRSNGVVINRFRFFVESVVDEVVDTAGEVDWRTVSEVSALV